MKSLKIISAIMLLFFVVAACKKDNDDSVDQEYPVIDIAGSNAFPIQCSTINRGQKFTFRAKFTDNAQLGSYSLDIHHNFDHHTHSTEVSNCGLDNVKTPVKPFLFVQNYDIPSGQKAYDANIELEVPSDVDPGDYHFMIRLTDHEGWQTIKGLSIKIK